ncbi:hypothetical protein L4X63_14760 [Geomonas sp. Red32]|uniref:hypothetical protein n=1 Tax=Geomonas sp. Red32 TaxID=2912856 RepID=UPI00202CCAC4|nr:hypothetical protein [Geomonas sp. Red32]MCM0082853.1 hypothetical protein [Geomonas sp. Red32]
MSDKIKDYLRIDARTSHLTIPEMVTTLISTGTALKGHKFFGAQGGWPDWLEGADHYLGYADNLRVLDGEYRAGNKTKKDELDSMRERGAFSYQLGSQYVTMRAYELKNPDLLLNTFPLKGVGSKASASSPMAVSMILTAKNGSRGQAILRGHHMANGGPYQLQYCKGNPTGEESWTTMIEHYRTCGKMVVSNLDPVSLYFFRSRHNGPNGPGPWSPPVSLIIH